MSEIIKVDIDKQLFEEAKTIVSMNMGIPLNDKKIMEYIIMDYLKMLRASRALAGEMLRGKQRGIDLSGL